MGLLGVWSWCHHSSALGPGKLVVCGVPGCPGATVNGNALVPWFSGFVQMFVLRGFPKNVDPRSTVEPEPVTQVLAGRGCGGLIPLPLGEFCLAVGTGAVPWRLWDVGCAGGCGPGALGCGLSPGLCSQALGAKSLASPESVPCLRLWGRGTVLQSCPQGLCHAASACLLRVCSRRALREPEAAVSVACEQLRFLSPQIAADVLQRMLTCEWLTARPSRCASWLGPSRSGPRRARSCFDLGPACPAGSTVVLL